ncbi:carboxypeptidase-like regulatory domain-containing protein [Limnoglobus roseus]|uniref:Carboxypeptidase regulatory-like domain-containing protein n=1 Tax=Limnoglobus roseus TaxID=2598579 RepID=A0A5C1AJ16_9BACT|nr:carboxypeptidase-like regulatory domain-containing protein [Limnoglobus roseus]QEL19439.1 carboxypeptidase regulatory-like domain-containing protein [Limnoglobus roseus]
MNTDTIPPAGGWRSSPPPPEVDRSPRRVFVAFFALLLVVGGIVALSTWATPRSRATYVSFVAPAAGGPPGFAVADHAAVARALAGRTPSSEPAASRATLEARLKALPSGRPAFVYISAAATCDADGRVIVFPPEGRPENPADGIPLRQILTTLSGSTERKFLVLDLSWPADSIPAEVAAGVVPTAVLDDLDAVPDASRLVLTSCGPGQVARVADELGRTAFGYYLEVGLTGWASPPGADAVTAYGLANFVRTRVQRWADQTRGTRQTPQLLGEGEDFPLVPLTGRPPTPPPELPIPADTADWLKPHWAARDRLRAAGADRLDPLAMRALGAELLAAEIAARNGPATPAERQVVSDLTARTVVRCERELAAKPFLPPNLAAVAPPADPALAAIVVAAVRPAATAKPEDVTAAMTAAAAKLATVPPASAARLVFDSLVDGRPVPREAVIRANDLIAGLTSRTSAVELVFLARLADTARATDLPWDGTIAARALAVCRAGEATARAEAFNELQPLLEAAARERYRGEELLLANGYVPPATAEGLLAQADTHYAVIGRAQTAATAADAVIVRALTFLTPTASRFAGEPESTEQWQTAVASLKATLTARERLGGTSSDDLARATDTLERATQRLKLRLADAASPFQTEAVKELVARAKKPDAGPIVVRALESLLTTDALAADLRVEVAAARAPLVARLTRGVLDADAVDGQPTTVGRPAEDTAGQEADERAERSRSERAVAALATLADTAGQPLPVGIERTPAGRGSLARELFRATGTVPANRPDGQLDLWQRTAARPSIPTTDALTPVLRIEARDETALRTWLAGWYDHASSSGGPFFIGAAAATRPAGIPPVALPRVSVTGGDLSESTPSAVRLVRVDPPTDVRVVVTPNDWFSAEAAPREPGGTPVRLALKGGSATAAPPAGFLAETTTDGRPTFARVPVSLDAVRGRLDLLFSRDPSNVVRPTDRPAVRPGGSKSTSYLFVRNPGDKPRTLTVELTAGATALKQSLVIPPGGVEPVRFPVATPSLAPPIPSPPATAATVPPATTLPELSGPLEVRVVEAGREILRRSVRPDIRDPAGYAILEAAELLPPAPTTEGKCRLEIRLKGGDDFGPPARVEMRFPDRSGPAPAGTLRGELREGGAVRLFADIAPAPADGEYRCFIDIDGVPRVYTFRGPAAPPTGPTLTLRRLETPDLTLLPPTGPRGPRLPVVAAVDHPPPDATLEVSLGRLTVAGVEADSVLRYPTARRTRIGFASASDGGLQFDADVRDWVVEFDAEQVRGRRVVRARMLTPTGDEIATAVLPLVLDDRAPQNVTILDLPKRAKLGTKLTVRASGTAEVAGIKQVQFFLGKSVEGKPPAGATPIAGVALNADRTTWSAELTLPKDKAGSQDVSVRFVSGTGVDAYANGTVELVDFDPVKSEPGTITGVVVMGDAPQANLDVMLTDEKGGVVKQAKTSEGGKFKFEGVPPGTYAVKSSRRASAAEKVGSAPAKLPPGGTVAVRVELYIK